MTTPEAMVSRSASRPERAIKQRTPRACAAAFGLIEAAQLPQVLDIWIRTNVSRLGLWSTERAEIAKELINHCHEALEQGARPDELAKELGDPKESAKMMKKAAKRKRPLPWRIARYGFWSTLGAIGLCVLIYGALILRFISGSPTISTDYLAMINAEALECDEDQHAWPVLKELDVAWKLHIADEQERQRDRAATLKRERDALYEDEREHEINTEHTEAGLDRINMLSPDHPDYAACVRLIESFAPELAQLREAASRECLGMPYSDRSEETEIAPGIRSIKILEPTPNLDDRGPFIGVLLPHLGIMRNFTRPLSFDARLAATQGDADRVHANLTAMLELAEHAQGSAGTIISDLVSIAVIQLVIQELQGHHLGDGKLVMSPEQLKDLRARLSESAATITLHTRGERMMFDDFLQRSYTDDGNGNGRITPEGIKLLNDFTSISEYTDTGSVANLLGPVALATMGQRKEQSELYHATMDTLDRVVARGPSKLHELQRLELEFEYLAQERAFDSPILLMTPAFSRAVEAVFMSRLSARSAMLAIDLELHRLDHGAYPDSLDQLTNAQVPEDIMNPGAPVLYQAANAGYVLYSHGEDGDDDNAVELTYSYGPHRHSLSRRFPVYHESVNGSRPKIVVEPDGTPRHGPPSENDGDWILIRVERDSPDAS